MICNYVRRMKMPTISKIRFTNVVYEGGNKRYADEIFHFHGENSAIVLENGGGKTVFIQTALQAILPHTSLANRKVKDTFSFDDGPAHIAIEWIKNDRPRIYALTAITIFPHQNSIDSYRYVYEYGPNDANSIENLPFTHTITNQQKRIASHAEMKEYYSTMSQSYQAAHTFSTITGFTEYIEKTFQIIADEWKSINTINAAEGDVEKFFEACPTEKALYEKLLIPTVEQSIAAFEKHQFVDIFEKHRDKFKLLKQLNAQLKEYDLIQKQLTQYVNDVFQKHAQQEKYAVEKQRMKAYFQLLMKDIEKNKEKLQIADDRQQQLNEQMEQLENKKSSYTIAIMEQAFQALTATYEELQAKLNDLQAKLDKQEQRFGNLKYANENRLLLQAKQQLTLWNEELIQLDEQFSTEDLIDELDKVKSKIRGNYLTLQEKYEQQLQEVQLEKRQYEDKQIQKKEEFQTLSKQHHEIQQIITRKETVIEHKEEEIEVVAKKIFDNDVQRQQPPLQLRTSWTDESQTIDERIVTFKNEEKKLELTQQQHEQRLKVIRKDILQLTVDNTTILGEIATIEKLQKQLIGQLSFVLPRVHENTSLHLKEKTLVHDLTQLLHKKDQLYIEKLHSERLAFRHVDDYGEQQSFFADPYVANRLPIWSQRFSYLETAIDYAAQDDQLQVDMNLLAITLITTDEEKSKLEQLLIDAAKNLTYPIQIWTLTEAIAISRGEQDPIAHIVQPTLWQELSDLQHFQEWQQKAEQTANEMKTEREKVDEERAHIKSLLQKLQDFYEQYPFEQYQKLQEQLKAVQSKMYELTTENDNLTKAVGSAEEEIRNLANKIKAESELKKYLDDKINQLLKYEKLCKDVEQLQQQVATEKVKIAEVNKQMTKAETEKVEFEATIAELKERLNAIDKDYNVQKAERHLYKAVSTYTPTFSEEAYEVLAQHYSQIESRLNGIISNRQQLEKQITQQQQYIDKLQNQIKQLEIEYNNLEPNFELPVDFERQLQQLPINNKALRGEIILLTNKINEAKQQKDTHEGALTQKRSEIEHYVQFEQPLPTVKYQLEEEDKRLQLQQSELLKLRKKLQVEIDKAQKLEQHLRIVNAENNFISDVISALNLTADEERDFSYRQQHFIDLTEKQLNNCKKTIEQLSKVVEISKEQFIQYCTNNVSEVRLRNAIIDGVRVKSTYGELVKHQQDMEKTIQMSRQYAEKDIKKHDEDLVQFVQRVHIHLRKVVNELKHIPRKTKVTINNEDKEIYRFSIPDWTDEEGLAQIRARVEWIMEQLEQLENRTVDEQESKQKVRKQLEEWLSTVQLLRYITQNKEWRVSCRKVKNDNSVSEKFETWSRSNAWSGGEKWSKNMALFLGVLNYVAEKRQHITSKKKSRTVILDNPFGKASSDHVLSPVFFIAKQLGFQIIALTAHVEGKFLHDYFPVVYSCRLRSAVGSDKLLMETKKTVHQAYFRDHNEDAEETVTVEQLELF